MLLLGTTLSEILRINHLVINSSNQSFRSIFQINPADQTFGEIGTIDHAVIDCLQLIIEDD